MEQYFNYQLCFIDNLDDWNTFKLYFTNDFKNQWGDDWDDRPANSNAGGPYTDKTKLFSIIVEFAGYGTITFGGKTYSVEDMNTKKACWLIYENIFFEGGDTLSTVLEKINKYNEQVPENKINIFIEYRENK